MSEILTLNKNPGLSGKNIKIIADEKLGTVQRRRNILQLVTSILPSWNSKSLGITIHAKSEAYKRPTVQNAARTIMKGLRYFTEKNSAKYENTTGIDPPTLQYVIEKNTATVMINIIIQNSRAH